MASPRTRRGWCKVGLGLAMCACLATTFFQLGRRWGAGTDDTGRPKGFTDAAHFTSAGLGSLGPSTPTAVKFARTHFEEARFKLHVSTDKPLYRPGEELLVRAVALGALDMKPVRSQEHYSCMASVTGPKGDEVASFRMRFAESAAGGSWNIPGGLPGGTYKVKVKADRQGWPPAEREFRVREFSNPSLRLQLKFQRDGYGERDEVVATVTATRATGGVPVGARVSFVARVDGAQVAAGTADNIAAHGTSTVTFTLPSDIEVGDGSLNVIVRDGGEQETVSKTLPLLLSSFDIDVYPEGGDLVVGLPSRVYVVGTLPSGDPADFAAAIVSVSPTGEVGESVATVDTYHEGRGVSTMFVPQAGASYQLRVTRPVSVKHAVPVPQPKPSGAVISVSGDGVFGATQPVSVRVAATNPGTYAVKLFRREREVAQSVVVFGDGGAAYGAGALATTVVLTPPATAIASAVLRVTLYNLDTRLPEAERLVFRTPRAMSISIKADKPVYRPGDSVELSVTTRYADNTPGPALIGVTVSDDSVLQRVERRKQPPRLPAMALLEDEVLSLTDSHTYLGNVFPTELPVSENDGDNGNGDAGDEDGSASAICRATVEPAVATDLLLGTQGWRRFVYEDPRAFLGKPPQSQRNGGWRVHGGNHGGEDTSDLKEVTQEEYERAERLLGVHYEFQPVFHTATSGAPVLMRAGGRGGGPVPLMAVPEMAMADGMAGGGGMVMAQNQFAGAAVQEKFAVDMAVAEEAEDEGGVGAVVDKDMVFDAPMMAPPPPPPMPMPIPMPAGDAMDADGNIAGDVAPPMPPPGVPQPPMAPRQKRRPGGRQRPREHWAPHHRGVRREFAHRRRENRKPNDRIDFADTLFWTAGVATGDDGGATFKFDLSDSVTAFRVEVDGVSAVGALLGSATVALRSEEPFYARLQMPTELTDGDQVALPVTTIIPQFPLHPTPQDQTAKVTFSPSVTGTALVLASGGDTTATQRVRSHRTYIKATAVVPPQRAEVQGDNSGDALSAPDRTAVPASLALSTTATFADGTGETTFVDRVVRPTRVLPRGFPQALMSGGMLVTGKDAGTWSFDMPGNVVPNSVSVAVTAYPTPVASITKALESLIRRPCGCFEQTSATTYPLTMAAQYFKTHSGVDPDLLRRSREMLEEGYKKLVGFESEGGGFEWFGGTPGHEALTAYGALQFEDMAKVMPSLVDPTMLQRTREWLLSRRDNLGGFERNPRSLDSFGRAPEEITNAYIVWALTGTSLRDSLSTEVAALADAADESKGGAFKEDPYFLGLVAGALYNVNDNDRAAGVAQRLIALQESDGSIAGATTSITCSRMASLTVEATAVSVLAWLNEPKFAANVRQGVDWLATQCKDGGFGSTQATVMALKAIIAYDLMTARPPSDGTVSLSIDGHSVGSASFSPDTQGAIGFHGPQLIQALTPGSSHTMVLDMTTSKPFSMPYSMSIEYNTPQPLDAAETPIAVHTALSDTTLVEGGSTELVVTVTNTEPNAEQPMVIVQVGLPGGLELRHDKVEELVAAGQIAFYEVTGRTLNLYWRGMAPGQKVVLSLDVLAVIPGSYTGDASCAYPYYADELKFWAPGLQVDIAVADA